MIKVTEQILALMGEETKIIPGHGALSNRAGLENYRQMLVDIKQTTEKAIAQGMTLKEFIASKPTAKYDEALGNGFLKLANFLGIVYKSLAQ